MQDFVSRVRRNATIHVLIQPYTEYSRVYYKLNRRVLSLEALPWFRNPEKEQQSPAQVLIIAYRIAWDAKDVSLSF